MEFTVDVQMTVRENGIIPLNVIESIFKQEDISDPKGDTVKVHLYIDASKDLVVDDDELLEILGESERQINRFQIDVKAAYKRNEMLRLGTSKYVYFADPDVLLPNKQVFLPMVRAFKRHPRLGAIGLRCHNNNHVSTASMMLRRDDLYRIGKIRARRDTCPCNYIADRLTALGKVVVPLKTVRATHLDREYKAVNSGSQPLTAGNEIPPAFTKARAFTLWPSPSVIRPMIINYELTKNEFSRLKPKYNAAIDNRRKIPAALRMPKPPRTAS